METVFEELLKEQKLMVANKGVSLINQTPKKKQYYCNFSFEKEFNLLETKESLTIDTNLPFSDWRYSYGDTTIEQFFEDMKNWCANPLFTDYKTYNRREDNKIKSNSWDFPTFRKETIVAKDVIYNCKPIAQEHFDKLGIDVPKMFREICKTQHTATNEEGVILNKFIELCERLDDYKRMIPSNSSYCSYGEAIDDTIKITIEQDKYNKKIKTIISEMELIVKKFSFLKIPRIDYWEDDDMEE